ncbi:hypothetical protein V6N11_001093 [Hibiscus sabdariffa]|uniref:PGG domain-containing protein n=1 Tax=Hibiscus sabdariffa TaxID=183260 RepID=A0ABR2RZH7_9ROSI
MESRLFEAARVGDVSVFRSLLDEDPFLLDRVTLNSVYNPLHVSVLAGQVEISKEIVSRKPGFTRELNENGFSPMHVASANGHVEIIRELMRVGFDVCLLKGKDGKVPLHFAASKGRIDAVKELVRACPESLKQVAAHGETALHLAVKNHQVDTARQPSTDNMRQVLYYNIYFTFSLLISRSEILTPSLTTQIIGLLIGGEALACGVNVNAVNTSGFTPKDIFDLLLQNGSNFHDFHVYHLFQQAGAMKAREITMDSAYSRTQTAAVSNTHTVQSSCSSWNLWKELMKEVSDASTETQNALMVVAVLIATVTYQAILSPPSGFWDADRRKTSQTQTNTVQKRTMMPGEAVMASDPEVFAVFTVFNAIGFFASLAMISLLTSGFPLRAGLRLAIFSMAGTYVIAVIYMGPTKMREVYVVVILMGLLFVAELVRFSIWLLKKWGVIH